MIAFWLVPVAYFGLLIQPPVSSGWQPGRPPTVANGIDPCALVSRSDISKAAGQQVAAGAPNIRNGMPTGYFSGTCAYVADGFTVVVGLRGFPTASLAKQEFVNRVSVATAPTYHGAKITVGTGIQDGAYWNADQYVAIKGHSMVSVTLVHNIKTSRTVVTHDGMRHLVTTALSKVGG